ncbi:hypothetical protein BC939DRAFT_126463 [Gamsiella multidivaricata]|uniref:uncharacterized protein n=1 Tax=Gamsiella multidivaricata TaxID=101098 RepID=UPI00221F80DB|nr:uncharacterized protein BC939DRAFT_126463 [Gamsiella multidivaricata]KAI7825272.1 hypothetical protein BC939DRAFT_126463 [Gamsiella multidivaricata]
MSIQFVKVASLVPDQHHCNLQLRVLSVETIAETVHPETGKIIQSAEAIVGDDSACILLNLKNDQVNLLAYNARLQVLNAHVNMYRGFMRLEVDEDEESDEGSAPEARDRPFITMIPCEDDDDPDHDLSRNGDEVITTMAVDADIGGSYSNRLMELEEPALSSSTVAAGPRATVGPGATAAPALASAPESVAAAVAAVASGSSSSFLAASATPSPSPLSPSSLSRDPLRIEMRLGTGGSVPLMEYYRMVEFEYFSTVEPVGR